MPKVSPKRKRSVSSRKSSDAGLPGSAPLPLELMAKAYKCIDQSKPEVDKEELNQALLELGMKIAPDKLNEIHQRVKEKYAGRLSPDNFQDLMKEQHQLYRRTSSVNKECLDEAAMARMKASILAHKSKDTVKVMVRVRPFMPYEYRKAEAAGQAMDPVVSMTDKKCNVVDPSNGEITDSYKFDNCFWSMPPDQVPNGPPFSSQEDVFAKTGVPSVDHAFAGYNTCIFAYGQTGSGKTYSMLGTDKDPGIAPRLVDLLFRRIEEIKQTGERTQFEVKVCFMEIYNEKVLDLLVNAPEIPPEEEDTAEFDPDEHQKPPSRAPSLRRKSSSRRNSASPRKRSIGKGDDKEDGKFRECKVRYAPDKGTFVEGITRLQVHGASECMQRMHSGMAYRATASHALNAQSSRSHAIFQLCLKQNTVLGTTRVSTINIVDLAGSERVKMTQASGSVLDEAKNINKSLSTLRRVIDVLIENAKTKNKQLPPYRESMLTWVLKDSLGGNSKTMMIAAISPHRSNLDDTQNTLRYALKAKSIVLHATVNEEKTATLVAAMKAEIEALQEQLKHGGGGGGVDKEQLRKEIESAIEVQKAELEEAQKSQKEAERLASEIREQAKKEMEAAQAKHAAEQAMLKTEVKDEKKARFAAVFRNAFLIEKKKELAEKEIAYLQKELKRLREEFEDHCEQAVRTQAELRATIREREERLEEEKEHSERLREEIEDLKRLLEAERKRNEERLAEMALENKKAIGQMKRQLAAEERKVVDLNNQIKELSSLNKEEAEKLEAEVNRLTPIEGKYNELMVRSEKVQMELNSERQAARQHQTSHAKAKEQLQLKTKENNELHADLNSAKSENARLKADLESMRLERDRAMQDVAEQAHRHDDRVQSMQIEINSMKKELDRARREKHAADGALASMREGQFKTKRDLVFQANDLEEKDEEIRILKAEVDRLKQQSTQMQAQLVAREHEVSPRSFGSEALRHSPTAEDSQAAGLRDYMQSKFFKVGGRREDDGSRSPEAVPPGERRWLPAGGYLYGGSPHRQRSPGRRSVSPPSVMSSTPNHGPSTPSRVSATFSRSSTASHHSPIRVQ